MIVQGPHLVDQQTSQWNQPPLGVSLPLKQTLMDMTTQFVLGVPILLGPQLTSTTGTSSRPDSAKELLLLLPPPL